jgi:hypothetical protein
MPVQVVAQLGDFGQNVLDQWLDVFQSMPFILSFTWA